MGQRFRQQVVVVTGASSGIGRAVAHAFAREGARLVIGARRKDELEEVAAKLRRGGREARAVPCNVTVPQQVRRLMDAGLERWDRLDVLVANAGVGLVGEIHEVDREDFRQVVDTNLMGVVNAVQAAVPAMIERRRGSIVIVSSILGHRGLPRMSGYCATKAALNALAESLMVELAPHGIHVVLACPGLTDTPFFTKRLGVAEREHLRDRIAAMPPETVADAIVEAVARRRRRVNLTAAGRGLVALQRLSPWLTDLGMTWWHERTTGKRPVEPAPPAAAAGPAAAPPGESAAEPAP